MPTRPNQSTLRPQNPRNVAAWQAQQGQAPGGGAPPDPAAYGPYGDVIRGANDVQGSSQQIGQNAQNWAINNPYASANAWQIQRMMNGDMSGNPWEQDAYNTAHNIANPMNDAFNALRQYIGGAGQPGGGNNGLPPGQSYNYSAQAAANPSLYGGGTGQGGGMPPDTVGGQNSFFAQQIRQLFDPSRLDPANDPTMAPYLAALRREQGQNTLANLQDLNARAEGSGMFGTGSYNALLAQAREQGMESLDMATAQSLMAAREGALARQMQGLDMTNTRDLGAMQDATNRYGIDAQSAASGAGAAAAAQDAAEGRRLQALGMMLSGGQNLLGFQGDMANMRQTGTQNALNTGLGFANLGLDGYRTGLQADQNRMSAYDLIRQSLGQQQNYQLGQAQNATARAGVGVQRGQLNLAQANAQNDAAMNMMQMLAMMSNMGGTTTTNGNGYAPGGSTMDPWQSALLTLAGSWGAK